MARLLRIEYPGAFYHIISRGVGRQNIFFKDGDEIGEYFGGIRPSAVSLGSRRIKEQIKTDKSFKKLVKQLESDVINPYN